MALETDFDVGARLSAVRKMHHLSQRELAKLTGVASVEVHVDHGHFWDQTQMTPAYRSRLAEFRACQAAHMTSLRQATQQSKGRLSR